MAYRAEIEIGVKGASRLKELQDRLTKLSRAVEDVNVQTIVDNSAVQSVNEYSRALSKATKTLNETAIQLDKNGNAIGNYRENIRAYVTALGQANEAQEITNRLTKQEIDVRTQATAALKAYNAAAAPARQVGSMAGAYLRPGEAQLRGQTSSINPQAQIKAAKEEQIRQEQQLLAANDENIKRLRLRARIEERIADVRSARIARERSASFSGTSGAQRLSPLAGPGSLGFPVALPGLSETELKGLRIAKQKLEIINRTVRRRRELVGLAANLQRLDNRSKVAIADANRQKQEGLEITKRELDFEERLSNVLRRRKNEQANIAKEKARRSARFNEDLLLGAGFPLLFGGGAGAVGGGVLGAVLGGGQGGFGAQIFFSAIGQQIDALAQKAQELGRALDPLTADIDKVIEAAGTAGQVSGQVAKELEELGFKERALEIATEDLAFVVGQDGVNALREFNDSTSELNRAINKLVLDVQVGIARILTAAANFSGTAEQREIRQARETARGILGAGEGTPELKAAFEKATSSLDVTGAFGAITQAERDLKREVDRIVAERDKALKAELQTAEQKSSQAKDTDARFDLQIEKERSKILAENSDLTNERVFAAERSIIFQEAAVKLSKEGLSAEREKQIRLERTNKIQELINKRTDLINKNNEKASRESAKAAKEILQAERAIGAQKLKQDELTQKISLVGKDRLTQVRAELNSLEQREVLERAFIISSTEDLNLQNEKLNTLALQFDLKEAQLRQTEKELVAQREINRLKREQEAANLRRDLTQELESLALPTGDPIDDAFINLQREQEVRRANEFASIDQAIAKQKQLLDLGKITQQTYNDEIQALNDKKAAFQELLPAIEAAQRQQLVYNETLNAVQGPVNALVFGLRDVANGTKTAEQAFADFLNVIANQFFTIAARMIAQYIAIGNARNFAFGGVGGGGGGAVGGILGLLFGGAFADGGYPPVGKASLVGEKGPELFVPNRAGKIIPNDELGGGSTNNISVSVDARQSEVQGNNDQSRQLGTAISRAIQVELAKQQRPGGLLYSTNR